MWFGKIDDLWQFGKPQGWGGPWWEDDVRANEPSDPYLMTGFDKKVLHLTHKANESVDFVIETDFQGNGQWHVMETVSVPAGGYRYFVFPDGYSAHWVRLRVAKNCRASAQFHYT